MSVMVFVPRPDDSWRSVVGEPMVEGFSATPDLHDQFDLPLDADEDAEYAAMLLASVQALISSGRRSVLGLEVAAAQVDDLGGGRVRVSGVRPAQVVSWFTDEDDVDVTAAAAAAKGRELDDAWEAPEVASLLADHPLLWHAAEELEG